MNAKWTRLALVTLPLLAFLAACGQPAAPDRVVVRDATHVLGADERDALLEMRDDGALVFKGDASFQAGDVLVSQPAAAAPNGLLRKVTAVDTSGPDTVLSTVQGKIGDALQEGHLSVERALTEADLQSVSFDRPGVSLLAADADGLNADDGGFRVGIDVKLGEGNLEPLTISGEVRFKPVLKVDLDLDCGTLCLYDNDLDFLAQIGMNITTDVKISGKAGFNLKNTVGLATFDFGAQTFFIGPVPVVITPKIVIELRTDGQVVTVINYQVGGTLTAVAGVKYDDGWDNISELDYAFHAGPTDVAFPLAGDADVKALAALRGELMLYGVVGPTLEIAPFVRVDLQYPRDPLLKLYAGIEGNVGVNIDVLGYSKQYHTNLWDDSVEVATSGNTAPQLHFLNNGTGDVNVCCTLRVQVQDGEDGPSCCAVTFSSSDPSDGVNGALGSGSGVQPEVGYTFTTLGERTITATATDSKGKTSNATLALTIVNTPPIVSISAPYQGQQFYRGLGTHLRGVSYDPNEPGSELACSSLVWASSEVDDPAPGSGCDLTYSFPTNGTRTLTLTGTDSFDSSTAATVTVNVVDPPADLPPFVNVTSPENGLGIGPDSVLHLEGTASDPEAGAVTLTWDATTQYDPGTGLGGATYAVTPDGDGNWTPSDTIPYDSPGSCVGINDTLRLRLNATDPGGTVGSDFVVIAVVRIC